MSSIDWTPFELFGELGQSELDLLGDLIEEQKLRAGEVLCMEGAEADGVILLAEGALDCKREQTGDLGRIEAPAVLGLASLALLGNREVSLRAAGPSRVLLLTRTAFHRFAQDAPPAAVRLLGAIVRELAGVLRSGIDVLAPPSG